jgi:alkylresorcinol/alkylpyrone synthase
MRILGAQAALPEHVHGQREITEAFLDVILTEQVNAPLVRRIHANAGVERRHLAMPLADYGALRDLVRPTTRSSPPGPSWGPGRSRTRSSRSA